MPKQVKPKKKATAIMPGKYFFTEEEKKTLSNQLANKQIDMRILEDEKKSVMSQYKDRIDRIKWDIARYSRNIVDGYEIRDFDCVVEKDYDAHLKRYVDERTGAIIAEKPLDPQDYQQSFAA